MSNKKDDTVLETSVIEIVKKAEECEVIDGRNKRGIRHSCSLILAVIIVGLMQKCLSIRSIADYFHSPTRKKKLARNFRKYFDMSHGFPSASCITRFVECANNEELVTFLSSWSYQLVNDDGTTLRFWGVDGQAVGASKLNTAGKRSSYNVDYYDLESGIMIYMEPVDEKKMESTAVQQSIRNLLFGHLNICFMGDAMMTKYSILDEVQAAGGQTIVPLKRNNPSLMDSFTEIIETLTFEGSECIDHYVDLNGEPDGEGNEVITCTTCTYEVEDNKKYDNPKSRPIREVAFFDNAYDYRRAETKSEDESNVSNTDDITLEATEAKEEKVTREEETQVETPLDCDEEKTIEQSDSENQTGKTEKPVKPFGTSATLFPPVTINPDAKAKWFLIGSRYITLYGSHGRYERREFELLTNPADCDIWENIDPKLRESWESHGMTIGLATRYRAEKKPVKKGKGKDKVLEDQYVITVTRTPYLLSFIPDSAKEFGSIIRNYWGVENNLHFVVDNLFGQDKCTCRVGNSTSNMSFLRKFAVNILSGIRNEIKNCHISYREVLDAFNGNPNIVLSLLAGKPSNAFSRWAKKLFPANA